MRQEFCIYPRKCSAECEGLNASAKHMQTYRSQLESIKSAIASLGGGGYSSVVSLLEKIITNVEQERKSLEALRNVLEQSVQIYEQTEAKIAGVAMISTKKYATGNGIDDVLADIFGGIADFRGNPWWVSVESLLLRGILTDYFLDDVGKWLSGTYLSSYWKDGRMYFKLNFDDMTNSQVAEWLKDNLGGTWDDYLARNMKNNGFSVFDTDSGILDGIRKFDDVTDAELLKYLESLKAWDELTDAGKFSFGNILKMNFNPLDDFNYKDFADLGNLGKAGKVLGTFGTVLTIGGDVVNNFYNTETGTWSFSGNQLGDCVVDVTIDIGAGAGSAALGATVGSFIVPPVGTVVGAGVGFVVDLAANNIKIADVDGDGQKDSAIDAVKYWGHGAVDMIEDGVENVLDWGSDVVDDIGEWFGAAFAF